MGAWSEEVLENDTALDLMGDMALCKDIKGKVKNLLHDVEYVDEILLAVAIVDTSLNGVDKSILGFLYEYEEWFQRLQETPMEDLRKDAMAALHFVQENDKNWLPKYREARKNILDRIEQRLKGNI